MNNFPAMTEERRQELIELCEAVLAGHVQYGGDSNEEDIYKTALAALTAEPDRLHSEVISEARKAGIAAPANAYTALSQMVDLINNPPVLRLPDVSEGDPGESRDIRTRCDFSNGFRFALEEVRRLNTKSAPPEADDAPNS